MIDLKKLEAQARDSEVEVTAHPSGETHRTVTLWREDFDEMVRLLREARARIPCYSSLHAGCPADAPCRGCRWLNSFTDGGAG